MITLGLYKILSVRLIERELGETEVIFETMGKIQVERYKLHYFLGGDGGSSGESRMEKTTGSRAPSSEFVLIDHQLVYVA